MARWHFVSDLHGSPRRYEALFSALRDEGPDVLLMGGDLLRGAFHPGAGTSAFLKGVFLDGFRRIKDELGACAPSVLLIPGNDDPRALLPFFHEGEDEGLWVNVHDRWVEAAGRTVGGYAYVPPSPFMLKDWERYDVSRYVDPGSVHPQDGHLSSPRPPLELRTGTIKAGLDELARRRDPSGAVMLFHSPPYQTSLDRAALDGKCFESVPLDVHVGSIAIRRFIEERAPAVTLHGHVHEAARITGRWKEHIGSTTCLSAAHHGPELALVVFDPEAPDSAVRRLI